MPLEEKNIINLLIGLFLTISIIGCNSTGSSQNSLCGITYTDISEVPPFKSYKVIGGDLLPKYKSFDNKYAIMHISDGIKHVLLFEDVTHKDPISLAPKHQIIDTITIGKIEEGESIVFSYCQQGTTPDPNIVALVTQAEVDAEFTYRVVKAWRVDFESMKIITINNTKGINCRLTWPD